MTNQPAVRLHQNSYWFHERGPFPRVTSVLDVINSYFLNNWKLNEVAAYAVGMRDEWLPLLEEGGEGVAAAITKIKTASDRTSEVARKRGTSVHAYAEALAMGHTLPSVASEIEPRIVGLKKFFDEHRPEFLEIEQTVFNETVGYAGTFDFIARLPELGNAIVLGDYKTSKAMYPKYAAQMAAYINGDFMASNDGTEREIPHIDMAVGILIHEDDYQLVPLDLEGAYDYFIAAHRLFTLGKDTKRWVLGGLSSPSSSPDDHRHGADSLRALVQRLDSPQREAFRNTLASFALPTRLDQYTNLQLELANKLGARFTKKIGDTPPKMSSSRDTLVEEMKAAFVSAGITDPAEQKAVLTLVVNFQEGKKLTKQNCIAIINTLKEVENKQLALVKDNKGVYNLVKEDNND